MKHLLDGMKAILPIVPGIIPFGAVMGTVYAEANVEPMQAAIMNIFVFAGASQLAAIDLMTKNTESIVIILTGLIINMRFMLYSAAMSPYYQNSNLFSKMFGAYSLTDQAYAVMMANKSKLKSNKEVIEFYVGCSIIMLLVWQGSVLAGFIFGNFAPQSLSLDFAVPVSFIALVIPTLIDKNYIIIAFVSTVLSIVLKNVPYNLGLICTAIISLSLAALLTRKKQND